MTHFGSQQAFLALREAILGQRATEGFTCEDVAFERLRAALYDTKLTPVDRVVRLRHALRFADAAFSNNESQQSLPLPKNNGWPEPGGYAKYGLRERPGGQVDAEPWRPQWLAGVPKAGVDSNAARSSPRRWNHRTPVADPWVTRYLGFNRYRGAGQSLAVRAALHMPDDKTLLVLLPTGEGKSLVFQALAAAHSGQTVAVVVPTVALALDHEVALRNYAVLRPDNPHSYVGGQNSNNEIIRNAIEQGDQGLVFAAPEAFVASLRRSLCNAAQSGRLAAIVIDEAHLVNAWGTDFRSEFQLLSALVAELRSLAPAHKRPRVICLSATVTQQSLDTLEDLFSPGQEISVVPSARLRPEPDIWISQVSNNLAERKRRVIEALCHLPRPAILYVTEQNDANEWFAELRNLGFGRIGKIHGGTSTDDRKKLIEAWRLGELDLVVGTSAFGLGIDYPHVRTVIHACVPESLDRYYQEIGRSGRDNCTSIALFIPTLSDFPVAKGLAVKKVITIKKGLARWDAMFASKISDPISTKRFSIDLSTSPSYDPDMRSGRSEDWNARVLNLMSRTGLIRPVGFKYDLEKNSASVVVDIINDGHLERETWTRLVEPVRQKILKANWEGFAAICNLLDDKVCPSVLFGNLYDLNYRGNLMYVTRACGGCSSCREAFDAGWFAVWPSAPFSPFAIGNLSEGFGQFIDAGRCLVERETDDFLKQRDLRRLAEIFDSLWRIGLRKCIVLGEAPQVLYDSLSSRPWCVVGGQTERILSSNGLPPGPEVVWIGKASMPSLDHFCPMETGQERIFLLPREPVDPSNPTVSLGDKYSLLPLSNFHDRLQL